MTKEQRFSLFQYNAKVLVSFDTWKNHAILPKQYLIVFLFEF